MIYVTGDIHAHIDIGKLSTRRFPEQRSLTKSDYLIICGDFGLVWNESPTELYWRKWLSDKPFTTLWVDGNHENFDLLYKLPLLEKFGGAVREIAPSVYHLDRGQVLTIDNKTFFVMGGAASHDKEYRTEHVSWWKEEMPAHEEMERGIDALERHNWTVDYVVSHCAPRSVQKMIADWYENDPLVSYLERVRAELHFRRWFFGHYHIDRQLDGQFTALYSSIVPLGETV